MSFDDFRLELGEKLLLRNGLEVSLQPKAFDMLAYFAERGGELVSHDELLDALWPGTYVGESNIALGVHTLRKTLGPRPDGDPYIVTVPKRGYRFNADVTNVEGAIGQNGDGATDPVATLANTSGFKNYGILAVSAIALAGIIVGVAAWQLNVARAKNTERLAVIPFSSVSGDDKSEFNILLADSLIRHLGKLKTLEVVPLKSIRDYAGRDIDAMSAAGSLRADLVLTGNYQMNADKIRTHVTLRRVSDNTTLLDETFDLEARENIDFETAVALRASKLVSDKLPRNDEAFIDKTKVSQEAIDNYLKGRKIWRQQTLDRNKEMQQHFERAIELAPDWAPAYSALAEALLSPDRKSLDFENAEMNARKALELDPQNAGANVILGRVYYKKIRDWKTAESYFQKALEADPNYAAGYHEFGRFLMFQRRFVAARQMVDRSIELDPVQSVYFDRLCELSYYERKTRDAVINCEIALSLNPTFSVGKRLHAIYVLEGKYSRIAELYSKGSSDDAILRQLLMNASATGDLSEYWQYSIEKAKARPGGTQYRPLASHYMRLNKHEEALDALEKSLNQYDNFLPTINVDPVFDPIRNNPRFIAVIEKLGLQDTDQD